MADAATLDGLVALAADCLRDPVVVMAGSVLMAVVFAQAALHKLRDRDAFDAVLAGYRLVAPRAVAPLARLLALAEAAVAAGVCLPATRAPGMGLAALLLLGYAGAIALNLRRGRRDIDCGCGGDAQRLAWPLVWRNGVLAALALAWTAPATERAIDGGDYLAAFAASLGLVGLHRVAEELIRQAGRLSLLRTDPDTARGLP